MRTLLRTILVLLLFAVVGFLAYGYWMNGRVVGGADAGRSVGTSGSVDVQKARERGAEIGEKAAVAAKEVGQAAHEAALTTKIKAKMALDDSVKARAIDVTTDGSVVTLTGRVRSQAERDRAVSLARETDGVTRVVDNLQVRP